LLLERRKSKQIKVGSVLVGGGAPISVQSMTNTDTRDITATIEQVNNLAAGGCDIVRVAVPDKEAAEALSQIVKMSNVPIIADIHFNYRLALEAISSGVQGLRLNPGNIGSSGKIKLIVKAAKEKDIPIRIGVNADL